MKCFRKKNKVKISKIIFIIISLIFFITFTLLDLYNEKISPKVIRVAEEKIKDFTLSYLSNNIGYDILNNKNLENILVINKNEKGEILYVDYNLDKAYEALKLITDILYNLICNLENGNINGIENKYMLSNSKGLVLKFPMFMVNDNIMFTNFGPDIYIKIGYNGTVLTNIKSKITGYGLNNALVELYVTIKITEELITPVTKKEIVIDYDVLVASKVINGRVPSFYNGTITEESKILDIPIE